MKSAISKSIAVVLVLSLLFCMTGIVSAKPTQPQITDVSESEEIIDGVKVSTLSFYEDGVLSVVTRTEYESGLVTATLEQDGVVTLTLDNSEALNAMKNAPPQLEDASWTYLRTDYGSSGGVINSIAALVTALSIVLGGVPGVVLSIANLIFSVCSGKEVWYYVDWYYKTENGYYKYLTYTHVFDCPQMTAFCKLYTSENQFDSIDPL